MFKIKIKNQSWKIKLVADDSKYLEREDDEIENLVSALVDFKNKIEELKKTNDHYNANKSRNEAYI